MDVTNPYEFTKLGDMDVTKPHEFIVSLLDPGIEKKQRGGPRGIKTQAQESYRERFDVCGPARPARFAAYEL